MRLRSRLQLLYFLFGTSFVLSTGLGGRFVGTVGDFNTERISHQSDEYTEDSSQSEYETTVTTNMAYGSARGISASRVAKAPTAPKSSKAAKGGHDIEYEYIPGGEYAPSAPSASVFSGKDGTKGSKAAKSSKKSKDNTKSGIKSTKAAKSAKSAKSKGATAAPSPYTGQPAHIPSSSSEDYPSTRPPSPISVPTLPTAAPVGDISDFTSSPTDADSVAFDLTPFALLYDLVTPRQASRTELAELTDVTRKYLEDFFFDEFEGSTFTYLDDFITKMVTSTFVTGVPYVVDYSSTARLNPFSSVFPSTEQLDESLIIAFSGENLVEYTRRVADEISITNVFRGAAVYLGDDVVRVSKDSGTSAATIAAAAVAATLLVAGVAIYKKRQNEKEGGDGKDFHKPAGDVTIAGETYTGETASIGATTLDLSSGFPYQDEPPKALSMLGTIEEGGDGDSTRQAWRGSVTFDEEENEDEDEEEEKEEEQAETPGCPRTARFCHANSLGFHSINRVATDNSSIATPYPEDESSIVSPSVQSFDDMALQGLSNGGDDKLEGTDLPARMSDPDDQSNEGETEDPETSEACPHEIASLLSRDRLGNEAVPMRRADSMSDSSATSRRPRTVAEIEAMLCADIENDEEMSQVFTTGSLASRNTAGNATKNRTVAEIESFLSSALDDDSAFSAHGVYLD